ARSGKTPAAAPAPPRRKLGPLIGIAAAVLAVAAGAALWLSRRPGAAARAAAAAQTTLAVLPFQNLAADPTLDHLRLALPDEVVTTLSYIPTLAIRPFASTQKYAKGDSDPQAAGRELRVADVLTGHFRKESDQLRAALDGVATERQEP